MSDAALGIDKEFTRLGVHAMLEGFQRNVERIDTCGFAPPLKFVEVAQSVCCCMRGVKRGPRDARWRDAILHTRRAVVWQVWQYVYGCQLSCLTEAAGPRGS